MNCDECKRTRKGTWMKCIATPKMDSNRIKYQLSRTVNEDMRNTLKKRLEKLKVCEVK